MINRDFLLIITDYTLDERGESDVNFFLNGYVKYGEISLTHAFGQKLKCRCRRSYFLFRRRSGILIGGRPFLNVTNY